MRTNTRSLPTLAATFFVATAALAASACGKSEAPAPSPGLCRQAKTIIITFDSGKATMSPDDKLVQLSLKNKDYVQWVSPDGIVDVTFAKGSPFESPPKHEKKVLKSGPPVKLGIFEYAATLKLSADGTEYPVDPRIEIVP